MEISWASFHFLLDLSSVIYLLFLQFCLKGLYWNHRGNALGNTQVREAVAPRRSTFWNNDNKLSFYPCWHTENPISPLQCYSKVDALTVIMLGRRKLRHTRISGGPARICAQLCDVKPCTLTCPLPVCLPGSLFHTSSALLCGGWSLAAPWPCGETFRVSLPWAPLLSLPWRCSLTIEALWASSPAMHCITWYWSIIWDDTWPLPASLGVIVQAGGRAGCGQLGRKNGEKLERGRWAEALGR